MGCAVLQAGGLGKIHSFCQITAPSSKQVESEPGALKSFAEFLNEGSITGRQLLGDWDLPQQQLWGAVTTIVIYRWDIRKKTSSL